MNCHAGEGVRMLARLELHDLHHHRFLYLLREAGEWKVERIAPWS